MENLVVIYIAHYFVLFPIFKVLFINIRYFSAIRQARSVWYASWYIGEMPVILFISQLP